MALTQWRFLNTVRLNRIVGRLAAELELARPLRFLARLPLVPALDDELTGRFTGKLFAADLVADDQEAVVNEMMTMDVVSDVIPNVKHGVHLSQKRLKDLERLRANAFLTGGGQPNAFRDWETRLADNLVQGVRIRMNAMACAMMLDSFSYNRFGFQVTGATWGMPANLKVTPSNAWSNPTTATPVSDIFAVQQVAQNSYGIIFDKITMGIADFWDMVSTAEFAAKAWLVLGAAFSLSASNLRTKDTAGMQAIATQLLKLTIELEDAVVNERGNAGSITTSRVLPAHKVMLSRSADEGNGQVYDMANGVPTETEVIDGLTPGTYGPVAYYTPRSHDANPPGWNAWGVARAFPRKFLPESTAVLTVG